MTVPDIKVSDYMTEEEKEERIREIAIHEAGHAVAMHLMTGGVGSVNINGVDSGGVCKGEGAWKIRMLLRKKEEEEAGIVTVQTLEAVWDDCVCTASGYAAEALFGFHGVDWDAESVAEYCGGEEDVDCDGITPDMRKVFDTFVGFLHFIEHTHKGKKFRRFSPHRKHFRGKTVEGVAVEDAVSFLKERKVHVEEVAEKLISRFNEGGYGTVWGFEVEEIIGSPPDEMTDIATGAALLGITQRELYRRIEAGEVKGVDYGELKRVFVGTLMRE